MPQKKKPVNDIRYLQSGTLIDQYIIERPLATGGFSCVYLARQLEDQLQVVIKEYLPKRLAYRSDNNHVLPRSDETRKHFRLGRKFFLEEAKVLAKLQHPNIVEVLNFFTENSTVYIVMTYDYGKNLGYYLKGKKGKLSENFMFTVFPRLLDGLNTIHEHGFLHLDIKPENIIIRSGGNPLLLDFGAVHPYPQTSSQSQAGKILTNGFSPIEQYPRQGEPGPWSDIYAIGATMRSCIEGVPPPPSPERKKKDTMPLAIKAFKRKYPQPLLEAIDWALAVQPGDRPQTAMEFLESFPNQTAN
ncbi:MAG: serine/threonine-protein kinase [Methylococcales bacterium]